MARKKRKRGKNRESWQDEWNEVQESRYLKGYWPRHGRIHPFFRNAATGASRRDGIILLVFAAFFIFGVPLIWSHPRSLVFGCLVLGIACIGIAIDHFRHAK